MFDESDQDELIDGRRPGLVAAAAVIVGCLFAGPIAWGLMKLVEALL